MASRALESEIDRLYQLPLEAFTPARNALAKGAGSEAGRIRALAKPPIAAWGVNQLFWRHAGVWNALLAAAENARRAHRAMLAGRAGDVRAAGTVHDEAVEQALKATLALLAQAGHPATDATKHTIGTTLRALPGDEPPGRLSRTLQPTGFEALAGLSIAAGAARAPGARGASAPAAPAARPGPTAPSARHRIDAKALTRARHAAAAADRALRDAENAVRREDFERVRTEREEQRAGDAVEPAREAAARATADLKRAEAAASAATRLRKAAAQRALEAREALASARTRAESAAADLTHIEKGAP
jgi:hypothetical protein